MVFCLCLFFCLPLSAQNVPPSITDPDEITNIEEERTKLFNQLIEEPTNLDNLFTYANLSILLGDLEAAVGVFEQMLIYDPSLPRIRLELGVLYYRLGAYATAKVYLQSVKEYDPPDEVLARVDEFLGAITESEKVFTFRSVFSSSMKHSSNGNSGLDADFIDIAGYAFEVSGDSKSKSDMSRTIGYLFTTRHDLKHPRGDTANYFLSLSDEKYDTFGRFDMQTAVFSASRVFNIETSEFSKSIASYFTRPSLTPSFTAFKVFLNSEGLLTSRKASLGFAGTASDDSYLSFDVYFDYRDFMSNTDKSGTMNGFGVSNNRILEKYGISMQYQYSYDRMNALVDWENYNQHVIGVRGSKMLGDSWMLSMSVGYRRKKHDAASPIFYLRKDHINSFSIDFDKPISSCMTSNFSYRYNDASSTVDVFNISNNQLSMNFSYVCFGQRD